MSTYIYRIKQLFYFIADEPYYTEPGAPDSIDRVQHYYVDEKTYDGYKDDGIENDNLDVSKIINFLNNTKGFEYLYISLLSQNRDILHADQTFERIRNYNEIFYSKLSFLFTVTKAVKWNLDNNKSNRDKIDYLIKKYDDLQGKVKNVSANENKFIELNNKIEDHDDKLEEVNNKIEVHDTKLEKVNNKIEVHDTKLEELNDKTEVHDAKLEELNSKIKKQEKDITIEIKGNIYSEFITILGIFTAITFAIFGGMNLLSNLFQNIGSTPASLGQTLILAAIFGLIMWGIIELLFYWISKIKGIEDSTKDKNKSLFNCVVIIIILVILGLGISLFFNIDVLEFLIKLF